MNELEMNEVENSEWDDFVMWLYSETMCDTDLFYVENGSLH